MKENNVHVLRNTCDRIGKGKDGIYITGIDDPASTQAIYEETKVVENEIKKRKGNKRKRCIQDSF